MKRIMRVLLLLAMVINLSACVVRTRAPRAQWVPGHYNVGPHGGHYWIKGHYR
ncbi:hypothetical protein ACFOG5_13365 [Pedobacter fastidiosus]|uniref:Lipoprotein n=1 Tax=Pedobacter fastidiosus TaxID=2765361 RepID=A0ABR7KLM2_9SPHI|nr:hypothetical protein [Pedobacter fastidiosus]MBC6108981.1 hypothetical protein [Pedobacter fastidiosus]